MSEENNLREILTEKADEIKEEIDEAGRIAVVHKPVRDLEPATVGFSTGISGDGPTYDKAEAILEEGLRATKNERMMIRMEQVIEDKISDTNRKTGETE